MLQITQEGHWHGALIVVIKTALFQTLVHGTLQKFKFYKTFILTRSDYIRPVSDKKLLSKAHKNKCYKKLFNRSIYYFSFLKLNKPVGKILFYFSLMAARIPFVLLNLVS